MTSKTSPWLILFGRSGLFLTFQGIFTLVFFGIGHPTPWNESAAWWPIGVTLANGVCLFALIHLFRAEGSDYWRIFKVDRKNIKKDLLAMLGFLLVAGPLVFFPNILLSSWLFENPQTALDLLVRPLPYWAAYVSIILFPLTQGMVEIALYFSYVMPRLSSRTFPNLRPIVLPALILGLQHLTLPLIFDARFILWRALMFIPFAFVVGFMMHWRPRLLPYIAIIHIFMDLSFAFMLLAPAY